MRILFLGGTGLISTAVTELLLERGDELTLLNRGSASTYTERGAKALTADLRDPSAVRAALGGADFDVVVNWIAYTPEHVRQDIELFAGHVGQYVFISSASAYEKPCRDWRITESTPLRNPFWEYSRDKKSCERLLEITYETDGFPYTIVRPSHTYGQGKIPVALSAGTAWAPIARMLAGKPMIVPGDGTSLWTVTHNSDFAAAFVPLLGQYRCIGQAYHITSDETQTWNSIHHTVAQALGVEAQLCHLPSAYIEAALPRYRGTLLGDKAESVSFDNSKIKRAAPGWSAKVSFAEGVRRALDWYDRHPQERRDCGEYQTEMDTLYRRWSELMRV